MFTSFGYKNSRVHERGVNMKTLVVKKYFLVTKDREAFESEILEHHPELIETILGWDDEELVEHLHIIKKSASESISTDKHKAI